MRALLLLNRHAPGWWKRVLLSTCIGALTGGIAVVTVNTVSSILTGSASFTRALWFCLLLTAMFIGNRESSRHLIKHLESLQHSLRVELGAALRRAHLDQTERFEARFERALDDLDHLSLALVAAVTTLQGAAFFLTVTAMIAQVSERAFAAWTIWMGAVAVWLWRTAPGLGQAVRSLADARAQVHRQASEFAEGLVQLKLDAVAAREYEAELQRSLDDLRSSQVSTLEHGHEISVVAVGMVIACSGLAILGPKGPMWLPVDLSYELATLAWVSLQPLFQVLRSIPVLRQAEGAATSLTNALESLEGAQWLTEPPPAIQSTDAPPRVKLDGLRYQYSSGEGQSGFSVGPLNLTLSPSTLVMVTGGNGSGKTTLMKLLLGLYPASEGTLYLDERPVTHQSLQAYRDHFTGIFGHGHLFDRPYGLAAAEDRTRVEALLKRFGILEVVGYDGASFKGLDLSSGQSMRLAMVIALLEERPLCVFDEWTANQDPQTTRFYYLELLPELLERGKTVLAVSHDERFFHLADTVIHLEGGVPSVTPGPGLWRRYIPTQNETSPVIDVTPPTED